MSLAQTTKRVFRLCAEAYLRQDRHWRSNRTLIEPLLHSCSPRAILDAGCGPGWHLAWLADSCSRGWSITGVDYCEEMLQLARERIGQNHPLEGIRILYGDIRNLRFEDGCFGLVLCLNNTLGNICGDSADSASTERDKVLVELKRVLAPQTGILVLSVYGRNGLSPTRPYGSVFVLDEERSHLDTGDLVVRYYSPPRTPQEGVPYYSHWFTSEEVRSVLTKAGLEIVRLEESGSRIIAVSKRSET